MSSSLPYLATPGTIVNCLNRIKEATTPPKITNDFVNTVLQIKGGAGRPVVPFLKKLGMVASDGAPTELYKKYRNQSTGRKAIAEAIKIGYRPLLENNEYFYKLSETRLKDCIVTVTGLDIENTVAKLIFTTLKNLMTFASFDQTEDSEDKADANIPAVLPDVKAENISRPPEGIGLNLSYTINLNLPATTDQVVFNAIFRSLKENLLSNGK